MLSQRASNRQKSKTRARVEHVFGFMEQSMNGLYLRSVGIVRATGMNGLINLTYNLLVLLNKYRDCFVPTNDNYTITS